MSRRHNIPAQIESSASVRASVDYQRWSYQHWGYQGWGYQLSYRAAVTAPRGEREQDYTAAAAPRGTENDYTAAAALRGTRCGTVLPLLARTAGLNKSGRARVEATPRRRRDRHCASWAGSRGTGRPCMEDVTVGQSSSQCNDRASLTIISTGRAPATTKTVGRDSTTRSEFRQTRHAVSQPDKT